MTNEQTSVLVLKDQAGEYYLLPQAALEQGRVPAEHKAEVEGLLAESDDVSGHAFGFLVGCFVGAVATLTGAAAGTGELGGSMWDVWTPHFPSQ